MSQVKTRAMFASIMLAAAAFFAFGAWFMYGKWEARAVLGIASESWPTVPATVTSVYVERVDTSVNRQLSNPYQPRIGFTYEVDGRGYYSNTFAATSPGFRTREQASAWLDAYPREGLLAHYDPEDPSRAVLEPGVPWAWHLVLLVPLACAATVVLILVEAVRGPAVPPAAAPSSAPPSSAPPSSPRPSSDLEPEATTVERSSSWSLADRAARSTRHDRQSDG